MRFILCSFDQTDFANTQQHYIYYVAGKTVMSKPIGWFLDTSFIWSLGGMESPFNGIRSYWFHLVIFKIRRSDLVPDTIKMFEN